MERPASSVRNSLSPGPSASRGEGAFTQESGNTPTCTIIAGPNGAGKTTFAMKYLPQINCNIFLNADMIAAGLAPFNAEEKLLEAGKLFLQEVGRAMETRTDFAFETTLSGKTHLARVRRMLKEGWRVNLIYLWLPGAEASLSRVQERVLQGGHNIPEKDILRRYSKSLKNLFVHYAPLCTETECYDNSTRPKRLIFRQAWNGVIVADNELFHVIRAQADMGEQTVVKEQREVYDFDGKVYELPAKRNPQDVDAEFIGQVLDYAVAMELERKRRLGFDAIIVENNMIMKLHPDGSMTEVGPVE